ncbi:MAG TPA: LLM class flavin-dependent oxidoreductase [Frankiaceae bacterium]|jgi:alkanesulfonate monooxygenase SsuD/methylene tetrahydromethanopterin reductase-like flavin-dependent oxidoreductase (luciferase family)|nr:LLM class flavin-dependent oxidoreductase [Frankiaceae bacterium]
MRVGTALPQRRLDATFLDVARESEDLGYASLSVYDHLVPLGAPDGTPVLEAFTTLAAVAAVTATVGLRTLVVRAPMRPPAMTAHLTRSLRAVAGERFVLGLGSGDASSAREDTLLAQPHLAGTARRESVRATVAAVRDAVPDLRVWVGGNGALTRALAEEVADGWNCWALLPAEVPRLGIEVTWGGQVVLGRTARDAAERLAAWSPGRDPAERERALTGTPDDVAERLRALAGAGVSEAVVAFVGGDADEQRRVFAREVLPLLPV